ncbi:MAG: 6-phosphogluconolactonase [Candidatus Limivicinus sp.]|nr:6-phosphogluconolactonase [Clostridiales bacterium]MDY6133254.1 6-phosphogluconolactonase [Candidatus Limivicinus sp.]
MKTVIFDSEELLDRATAQVKALLDEKPDAVLALSAGEDCLRLLERLAAMQQAGELRFSRAKFFAVTELCGGEHSVKDRLTKAFFSRTDAQEGNCVFLTEDNFEQYDEMLSESGGIDLAILDIGLNARIGFNEPATAFDSLTHRQKLSDSSRRELAPLFGTEEKVPEYGLTMGIKTLVSARSIMLLATGESRAEPVFRMLYGRNDSFVPAAFLQIPLNVTVYLDGASAEKL